MKKGLTELPPPVDHSAAGATAPRPVARGKFIWLGDEKLLLRGVTYGPMRANPLGENFRARETVAQDFAAMRAHGINSLRTYTVPPRWLLDLAQAHGLWVLVGLAWYQPVGFLDDAAPPRQICEIIRDGVRACAGHPALLGFAIGNEIPAPVVRWHGARRIEKFLEKLFRLAKHEAPDTLVAYVNYPSTEYLDLPFADLFCFNVYLETPARYTAYLARLQNLAADKPLLLTETGLDSRRNGEAQQAAALDWQIRRAFSGGCAGVFVFAWTDEWWREGQEILDWDFGLVRRNRTAKPALLAVQKAFAEIPFAPRSDWPRVSVVICTHKGFATLEQTLAGVAQLDYPNYETIVVNDGADEQVAAIAKKFSVRLLEIAHSGLSVARNVGCAAATSSLVAYLDDDAWPDPHWLQFLADTFATTDCAAVGGPNIPPPSTGLIANCVAHAPGGPIHVLLTDREAEHIPGCNMAFRKTVLQSLGGFDAQFRTAGDDVDLCWRVTDCGYQIGFNPGAMVWHHRRQTVGAYWKQQVGYGRAEALLERKWPTKYNAAGQPRWHGRIYGAGGKSILSFGCARIYHGTWGSALFQSIYEPAPSHFWALARMPEWYLVILQLAVLASLEILWSPLKWVWPLCALAILIPVVQSVLNARKVAVKHFAQRPLLAWLHLLQPLARLRGRVKFGLAPWRPRRLRGFALPGWRLIKATSRHAGSPNEWLTALETSLETDGVSVFRGGDYDRWDLAVRGGVLGSVRARVLVEDYGANQQLIRLRLWPRWHRGAFYLFIVNVLVAGGAWHDNARKAAFVFGGIALFYLFAAMAEWAAATRTLITALRAVARR